MSSEEKMGNTSYVLTIHTSDVRKAGTNATIKMQLVGENGQTEIHEMDTVGYNDFEQNDTDDYKIRNNFSLGVLTELRVYNDGSGSAPDWHLGYVLVREDVPGGEENYAATFNYNDWTGTERWITIYPS
ncbi:PLAT/LH2 domain-containing protein [Thiomicrorhabdus sp.]|uniref:PLAT/LH2 domain-containing protein n=1 Tax=Thiomicrorhabdus sp. TaxID=2039724 RepID=UPI0029C7640E|nr:PLAT/LH2 domain-containing protein [Thiomicrorhabdus sp.]